MPTVNVTSAIDRDLLRRAKVLAAKTDTSVNALFNAELRYLVETFEAAEAAGNRNFRVLFDFSMGRIDSSATVEALGLEGEEDLEQKLGREGVEVIVGATELKLAELFAMAPGAVLALDREVDGPLELRVRGKTVAQGVLVAVGDRFGVRITEVTGQ
jgi:flagellar motor switch/type III secretory pathway protein FliN